mmetsp:Transcript_21769/g.45630  ORF Transcript_21769/g.45630 Transcript_21769/m.45630 type:complete len:215 (+) Transcript_21769:1424-2068(+)
MPRRKVLEFRALLHNALHFTRDIHAPIIPPSDIQRSLPNMIPKDEEGVGLLVVHDHGEHTAQFVGQFGRRTQLRPQRQHDLAIAPRQRSVRSFELVKQFLVVVHLSVRRHDHVAVPRDQGLRSRFGIHDGETLVRDAVIEGDVGRLILFDDDVSGPIGTAVAELGGTFDELLAEIRGGEGGGEDGEDAAHGFFLLLFGVESGWRRCVLISCYRW